MDCTCVAPEAVVATVVVVVAVVAVASVAVAVASAAAPVVAVPVVAAEPSSACGTVTLTRFCVLVAASAARAASRLGSPGKLGSSTR